MSRKKKKHRDKYMKKQQPDAVIVMPKAEGTKVDFGFSKTCHECNHSKSCCCGAEVYCNNKKSKAYNQRVRSWETCDLWKKQKESKE